MTCNCYSYNWCIGEVQEVVLDVPKDLQEQIRREYVCVDACIVEDIKALWKAGIVTNGACCGHNKVPSMIVLEDNVPMSIVAKCEGLLSKHFELYSWQLPLADPDNDKITKVN